MKYIKFLFVIAAIGCATTPPPPPATPNPQTQHLTDPRVGWKGTPSETIDRRFDAAWRYVLSGDFANARKRLADIQARDASYAPAQLAEAAIEIQEGKTDAARQIAEGLTIANPDYTAAQIYLAELDVAQNRIRAAYERYRDLAQKPDASSDVKARYAELQTRIFDQLYGAAINAAPADAVQSLREALEVNPNANAARVLLAQKLTELQQYDEARRELDPLVNTAAGNQADVQETLAEIDVGKGEYENAISRYERLARNDPKYNRRLDQVKQLFAAANLPPQVSRAMQAPALTRADLAVLMYWTIASIRFAQNVPPPPIAIDIADIGPRDEVIRAMALGIYPVDPVTRRVVPDAEVTDTGFANIVTRVLRLRGAPCAQGLTSDQILTACGIAIQPDDLPVSGQTATSVLQQVDRALTEQRQSR